MTPWLEAILTALALVTFIGLFIVPPWLYAERQARKERGD